jgi:precorrin-6B methylase 1
MLGNRRISFRLGVNYLETSIMFVFVRHVNLHIPVIQYSISRNGKQGNEVSVATLHSRTISITESKINEIRKIQLSTLEHKPSQIGSFHYEHGTKKKCHVT